MALKPVDPLDALKAFVARFPSQRAAAQSLGIKQSYMSDLMHGNRPFSEMILDKLGLSRVVVKQ